MIDACHYSLHIWTLCIPGFVCIPSRTLNRCRLIFSCFGKYETRFSPALLRASVTLRNAERVSANDCAIDRLLYLSSSLLIFVLFRINIIFLFFLLFVFFLTRRRKFCFFFSSFSFSLSLSREKPAAAVIIVKALKIRALFDVASVTINEYSCRNI